MDNPVVQVIDAATDDVIYTVRIKGDRIRPKVFKEGEYHIGIGEPETARWKVLENIKSESGNAGTVIKVRVTQG